MMKHWWQSQLLPEKNFPDSERTAIHCLESGCIGKYLEIYLGRGFCTPRPSGNISVLGGSISQYIPPLSSVRMNYHHPYLCLLPMNDTQSPLDHLLTWEWNCYYIYVCLCICVCTCISIFCLCICVCISICLLSLRLCHITDHLLTWEWLGGVVHAVVDSSPAVLWNQTKIFRTYLYYVIFSPSKRLSMVRQQHPQCHMLPWPHFCWSQRNRWGCLGCPSGLPCTQD